MFLENDQFTNNFDVLELEHLVLSRRVSAGLAMTLC